MTVKHSSWKLVVAICLLACAVGLIHAGPNIWYRLALGSEYRGIALWNSQDELDRLAGIREVEDGDYVLKSLYLLEDKAPDRPPSSNTPQPLSYLVPAWLHRLVGGPMDVYVVFMKFLFPAILFALVVWWVTAMTGAGWVGVLAGLAATLMPTIWSFNLIFFNWRDWWGPHLIFMRPVTQVAVCFWMLALIFWERGLSKQRLIYTVLAAVALSATVYSYFFYWTFTYAMLGIFAVIAWRQRESQWLRHTLLTLAGATLLAAYAWLQYYQLSGTDVWSSDAFGGAFNHAPAVMFIFQALVVALMLLGYWVRRLGIIDRKLFALILAFGLSHIVVLNQQVLTGVVLELHHYEWFVGPVLFTILLCVVLYKIDSCPGGWQRLWGGLKRLSRRRGGKALICLVVLGIAGLALVIPLKLFFPQLESGIPGKVLRVVWSIDPRLLTIAVGLGLLVWGVVAARSHRWFQRIGPLAMIFILGIVTQIASYQATAGWQAPHQALIPALEWLNEHAEPESVILTSPTVANYLVVYTPHNVFFTDYAMGAPTEVFHDRALKYLAFIGYPETDLEHALDGRSSSYDRMIKAFFFYWRPFSPTPAVKWDRGRFLRAYTPAEITPVMDRYRQVSQLSPEELLRAYRADYVVEYLAERPGGAGASQFYYRGDLASLDFLEKVFDDGMVRVFAVKGEEKA